MRGMREITEEVKKQERPGNRGTRFLGILLCILLAAGLGAAVVCCYPMLWKEEKKILECDEAEKQSLEEEAQKDYERHMSAMAAGIYLELLEENQTAGVIDPWEVLGGAAYVEAVKQQFGYTADDMQPGVTEIAAPEDTDEINYYIDEESDLQDYEWERYISKCREEESAVRDWYFNQYVDRLEHMQLEYMIYKKDTGEIMYSKDGDFNMALVAPFMVKIAYDGDGMPTVVESRGATDNIQQYFDEAYGIREDGQDWDVTLPVPKMMEYVAAGDYVIAQVYTDQIRNVEITMYCVDDHYQTCYQGSLDEFGYYSHRNPHYWEFRGAVAMDYGLVTAVAFIVLIAVTLILSFIRPLALPGSKLSKIPLELLFIVIGCYVCAMGFEGIDLIIGTQTYVESTEYVNQWSGILKTVMNQERESSLLYLLNWAVWSGMFLCCIPGVLSIRQLFAVGLRRYVREYTLTGKICSFLARRFRGMIQSIREIDFEENGNRKIIKAVIINFIIVTLLCCVWFAGIVGVILYSTVLLVFLTEQYRKMRQNYRNVREMASRMAEGNLDAVYTGDCGIFTGLSEELSRVQQGFQTAVAEEVKSQRMKTELITNVSHDLKTPLTAIITYVDLLKNPELPVEERESYVEVLAQKSARLKVLIEDLFEVSKANSGTIALHPTELDLAALLQEIQIELEDKIMQSGIEFRVTMPQDEEGKPKKLMLMLDGEKTSRIFENLIINIVKYGMPGSRAYLDVTEDTMSITVTLKNMSRTELNFDASEITERFVRGDASRNTEGSGLGLAIAKSFAEAQGGSLEIQTDGDLFKAVVRFVK